LRIKKNRATTIGDEFLGKRIIAPDEEEQYGEEENDYTIGNE
jgi:hypothetical protein